MAAMMTGPQKTAILCLALGEKFAGEVFKRLDRREIATISKAMMEIETVPKEQVEEVVHEFNDALQVGRDMVTGGPDQVRRLLSKTLDSDTAKYIMETLELDTGPTPFQELSNVSPRILAQILRNEHPQTLALILGHLHPDQASELLQNLPSGVRAQTNIEQYSLAIYDNKQLAPGKYELRIPYENENEHELNETMHQLLSDIHREADLCNCNVDANAWEDGTERRW